MYMHFALNRYLTAGEEVGVATPSIVSAIAEVNAQNKGIYDVMLQLNIADGWHINANPAGQDNLIPTTITVGADTPLEIIDVAYPKGRSTRFEFSSESLNVYEESLTIPLQLKQKSNMKHDKNVAIILKLTYQLCNETECLLPQTLDIPLEVP